MLGRFRDRIFAVVLAPAFALAPIEAEALVLPRHQAAWPALTNSSSLTSACNRLMFPMAAGSEATYVSGLGHIYCASPNYSMSNIRFLFANFYVTGTGANNPELCPETRFTSTS